MLDAKRPALLHSLNQRWIPLIEPPTVHLGLESQREGLATFALQAGELSGSLCKGLRMGS